MTSGDDTPMDYVALPMGESGGHCDCCGKTTRTVWGEIVCYDTTIACYYVSWTEGDAHREATIDMIYGRWGEGSSRDNRGLASLLARRASHGGGVMVIDAAPRHARLDTLCAHAHAREEVIQDGVLKPLLFALVDAIFLHDARVAAEMSG